MASPLALMKKDGPGAVVETGLEFGAGYGLGRLYVHYQAQGEEGKKKAEKLPYLFGGLGKAGAALCHVFGGPGLLTSALNGVGAAGVSLVGLHHGLQAERKKLGVATVQVAEADVAKVPGGRRVALGALPPAQPGRGPSWDIVQEMASMH